MAQIDPAAYEIFCEAIEIESIDDRAQFIKQACSANHKLEELVYELIDSSQQAEGAIDSSLHIWSDDNSDSTMAFVARSDSPTTAQKFLSKQLPIRFGDYVLVEKLRGEEWGSFTWQCNIH